MTKAQRVGFFEVPPGLAPVAFLLIGEASVGIGLGVVRRQVNGPVVVRNGPFELAFLPVDVTPVAESFGKIGVQTYGLIVILDSPVKLAKIIIGIAAADDEIGIAGFQADSPSRSGFARPIPTLSLRNSTHTSTSG